MSKSINVKWWRGIKCLIILLNLFSYSLGEGCRCTHGPDLHLWLIYYTSSFTISAIGDLLIGIDRGKQITTQTRVAVIELSGIRITSVANWQLLYALNNEAIFRMFDPDSAITLFQYYNYVVQYIHIFLNGQDLEICY